MGLDALAVLFPDLTALSFVMIMARANDALDEATAAAAAAMDREPGVMSVTVQVERSRSAIEIYKLSDRGST